MSDHVPMYVFAALLPPDQVLEDLAAVVRSVRGSAKALDPVPAELMHLPLGHFGNVGLVDRTALQDALKDEVASWSPLQLRFRGGSALIGPGDDSVWAELAGDVEQLAAMGTAIPRVVQRLGFLIDRRVFRTRLRVGRITSATSVEFLERLLSRMDGYAGPAWTAHHVSLLRRHAGAEDTDPVFDVLHELPMVRETGPEVDFGGRHRVS